MTSCIALQHQSFTDCYCLLQWSIYTSGNGGRNYRRKKMSYCWGSYENYECKKIKQNLTVDVQLIGLVSRSSHAGDPADVVSAV